MSRSLVISSAANPLLKDVRRALERGSLTSEGYTVAETFHLLEEALGSRCEVHTVLAAESAEAAVEARVRRRRDVRVAVVTDRVFEGLVSTESSQGVIALVRPPAWTLDDLFRPPTLLMVLDGLQDPGNAGSILRGALWKAAGWISMRRFRPEEKRGPQRKQICGAIAPSWWAAKRTVSAPSCTQSRKIWQSPRYG